MNDQGGEMHYESKNFYDSRIVNAKYQNMTRQEKIKFKTLESFALKFQKIIRQFLDIKRKRLLDKNKVKQIFLGNF